MDLTPYVDSIRRDLVAAADAGDEDLRRAGERLAAAVDPAVRLAMMEAISHAAAEITAELPQGGVDVRLSGRELEFTVQAAAPQAPPPPPPPSDDDEGEMARITLRIPESVKAKAEEKAARAGHSLNTWLVSVVRAATNDAAINVDIDLSSIPFVEGFGPFTKSGKRRMSGWV